MIAVDDVGANTIIVIAGAYYALTTADDAFNAGLAVALAEGQALPEAIRFANAAAAVYITRQGTAASMPNHKEVNALL